MLKHQEVISGKFRDAFLRSFDVVVQFNEAVCLDSWRVTRVYLWFESEPAEPLGMGLASLISVGLSIVITPHKMHTLKMQMMVIVRSHFSLIATLICWHQPETSVVKPILSGAFIALCKTLWVFGARLMATASQTDVKMDFFVSELGIKGCHRTAFNGHAEGNQTGMAKLMYRCGGVSVYFGEVLLIIDDIVRNGVA